MPRSIQIKNPFAKKSVDYIKIKGAYAEFIKCEYLREKVLLTVSKYSGDIKRLLKKIATMHESINKGGNKAQKVKAFNKLVDQLNTLTEDANHYAKLNWQKVTSTIFPTLYKMNDDGTFKDPGNQ